MSTPCDTEQDVDDVTDCECEGTGEVRVGDLIIDCPACDRAERSALVGLSIRQRIQALQR